MGFRCIYLMLFFVSCTKAQKKPTYLSFLLKSDSIFLEIKNPVISPSFLKITDKRTDKTKFIDFRKPDTLIALKFHQSKIDTTTIIENYDFKLYYGLSTIKEYDTLYNYGLPFLKKKRYKVLQGQNTNFTHKGNFSRYAIDFKMKVGQKVCAIRDGLVVKIKEDSNIGGKNKKYKKDANLIVIFHDDGTFAQYVHLKKNGVLVEKGDSVLKGQVIGYTGNTGMSTEPHLHFAVYKPTKNGLVSIPFMLNGIPSKKYKKGKYASNK